MKRTIWLADCKSLQYPYVERYPRELQDRALAFWRSRGLRFDNQTGIIRDSFVGVRERPASGDEHTSYATLDAILEMEFGRYVTNAAGRLHRGLYLR